jgi:hypothetical protein
MPTRAVTIMCLVQIGLLVLAWMLTSKFTHMAERAWETLDRFHTPRLFKWLCGYRTWGLSLLTVPVAVAVFCTRLTATHRGIAIVGEGGFRCGLMATLCVMAFAIFVIWTSFNYAFSPGVMTPLRG